MQIIVRKYGLLAPVDWGRDCDDELYLQNKLWNALVDIEIAHRDAVRALTAEDPAVAEIDALIDALKERRAAIDADRKQRRKATRSKATPDLDAAMADLTAKIGVLVPQAKAARAAAREAIRPKLAELEEQRRAAVKRARQQSGLWWGNYNAVVASYDRARQASIKRGGELRKHYHDGSGRITNQIQGGMSADDLFAGRCSQVSVRPLPDDAYTHPSRGERRRLQRTTLTATIYARGRTERRLVHWPMVMHRPIPEGAMIKEVVVHRERIGTDWRWSVVMTCTIDEDQPAADESGDIVAVDLGFRRMRENGVRVATVLREDQRIPSHVMLPEEHIEAMRHVDDLLAERSLAANGARDGLKGLPWGEAPPPIAELGRKVATAARIGTRRIAKLAIDWRISPDWHPESLAAIETWRRKDKRMLLEQEHLRDKVIAARKDAYRKAANSIVKGASTIIIDKLDLHDAMQVERMDGLSNNLPAAARHYRTLAAPSEFRTALLQAAARHGVRVAVHEGISTWVCHACGATVEPDDPAERRQHCKACGSCWDQDYNACRNMLRQASAAVSTAPEDGARI